MCAESRTFFICAINACEKKPTEAALSVGTTLSQEHMCVGTRLCPTYETHVSGKKKATQAALSMGTTFPKSAWG